MTRRNVRSIRCVSASALLLAFGLTVVGCGEGEEPAQTGEVGAVDVNLQMDLAGNVIVNQVNWTIAHGSNGYNESGIVDTSTNVGLFSLQVSRIPADTGYTLTLTATAVGNVATCTATATFGITAGNVTSFSIEPKCTYAPEATGTVEITGTSANFCPEIDQAVAAVLQDGAGFDLSVVANDDGDLPTPDNIEYLWTTTGTGTLVNTTTDNATYQCSGTDGAVSVTIAVTDDADPEDICAASQQLDLTCTGAWVP